MKLYKNRMRKVGCFLLLAMGCCYLTACNSRKAEVQKKVEQMQASVITVPYEQMECWATDSVISDSPWNKAKLQLVHYVDSATCSSCYLRKVALNTLLFGIERLSNNEFYNVFIITPDSKAKETLKSKYQGKQIPQTIFVDTANIFMKANPNIPSESMFHTFLLDENNKVVLVGNPMLNNKIEDMMISILEEKLGRKFCIEKINNE